MTGAVSPPSPPWEGKHSWATIKVRAEGEMTGAVSPVGEIKVVDKIVGLEYNIKVCKNDIKGVCTSGRCR